MSGYNQPKSLLEQQAMTFCALMKAMQGHLTADNILSVADKVWRWTVVTLNQAAIVAAVTEAQDQKEAPQENQTSAEKTAKITDKQQKRLFAIARNSKMSTEQLKAFLKDNYDIESTKDIPWQQYREICEAVENFGVPF